MFVHYVQSSCDTEPSPISVTLVITLFWMLVCECEDHTRAFKFPFWVPRSESSTEVPILSVAPDNDGV